MSDNTMPRITSADAGTWLEGSQGWHNAYRVIWRAQEYGLVLSADDAAIANAYAEELESVTLSTGETLDADTIHVCVSGQGELSDRATEYLQSITQEGWIFEWDCGELYLYHSGECVDCKHDCPWTRVPGPIGAPFCSVCDDHMENSDDDA